jgi:microcystin-dependent protein
MGSPYVGEIRQFAGNFAPNGWSFCNGATLSIAQNDVLFNLIGTTYGGDGVNTFNLPNLQGRFPIHQGTQQGGPTYVIGQLGGNESVTLLTTQLPAHTHGVAAASVGGIDNPAGNFWAASTAKVYTAAPGNLLMNPNSLPPSGGGGQPHDNMSPFLVMNYIISLFGIFPSQ